MRRGAALGLALLLTLTGCTPAAEPCSATLFAMDTSMEWTLYGSESLLPQAEQLVLELEKQLSVTDPDSEIAALNRTGSGHVSPGTEDLLSQALALCGETGGALDISIYPVVRAWGFTTGEYHVPDPQDLARQLQAVDYTRITVDGGTVTLAPGMQIDLGSVAKGWAGDRLVELFRQNGVESALLNLGGNVQALGAKPDGTPWRVAVTDPEGGYTGVVQVAGQAVITSGGYERYFRQDGNTYHHILDPATGFPADNGLLSVTIIGGTGLACDAFSTALFVMGPEKAARFWRERGGFEVIFITQEGLTITSGLKDRFTPLGRWEGQEPTILYRETPDADASKAPGP